MVAWMISFVSSGHIEDSRSYTSLGVSLLLISTVCGIVIVAVCAFHNVVGSWPATGYPRICTTVALSIHRFGGELLVNLLVLKLGALHNTTSRANCTCSIQSSRSKTIPPKLSRIALTIIVCRK